MPSRTLQDKVEDLTKVSSALEAQVAALITQVAGLAAQQAEANAAIGELKTAVASAAVASAAIGELKTTVTALSQQVAELRLWKDSCVWLGDARTDLVVLKRDMADVKKWQDDTKRQQEEWGRKLWLLVPPVVAALLTGALSTLVTYFLRK